MRLISVDMVATAVEEAVQIINFHTPRELMDRLVYILENEPSPIARRAMADIIENRRISSRQQVSVCQDAGMVIVFVELGQEVHLVGGGLVEAVNKGVRNGYRKGYLRKSVVEEPIFDRRNTGDNTPAVIHLELVPGEQLQLTVAAKGFGAENMSRVTMLTPADGVKGVKREVIRCVEKAGPNACPPMVVGVGVGGTLEMAGLLAKKALTRALGKRHPDPRYARLEVELLDLVNATGIGPQGWGGVNTAMDVRVEHYPTHIAAIPLAVNLDCHLRRHVSIVV